MIKPLICNMRARDIKPVLDKRNELKFDQLSCNYINSMGTEPEVYRRIRDIFLNDERFQKYTHLVIAPDDLIVENHHIEALINDLEAFDYPVLSGICNVDMSLNRYKYAICIRNLPNRNWDDGSHTNKEQLRFYDWATEEDIKEGNIIRVLFSGFPLMFIRRDIVEKIPFETDFEWNKDSDPNCAASIDVTFNTRCYELGIPVMADCDVNMTHLRYGGKIKVGIKHKSIDWIRYREQYKLEDGTPMMAQDSTRIFFERVDTIRLVVAMSIREEVKFLPRAFESLKTIDGIDAVYVMDGSYMKGFHAKSDSHDGSKDVCMAYEKKFKEFYFRPAMGRFYDSQSQKRNLLFDWIEEMDSDQELWIFVFDGDEEIKWNDAFFNLKEYLKSCKSDIIFMQTNPSQITNHPMENSGVRLVRGKQGIRWAEGYSMRYVDKDGNLMADYSPRMHLTCVNHDFINQIWIKNNWNEKSSERILEKQKYLQQRSKESNERRLESVR